MRSEEVVVNLTPEEVIRPCSSPNDVDEPTTLGWDEIRYSSATEEHLKFVRRAFSVPESIEMRLPVDGERADDRLDKLSTLYVKMFTFRVRLPLHPIS